MNGYPINEFRWDNIRNLSAIKAELDSIKESLGRIEETLTEHTQVVAKLLQRHQEAICALQQQAPNE